MQKDNLIILAIVIGVAILLTLVFGQYKKDTPVDNDTKEVNDQAQKQTKSTPISFVDENGNQVEVLFSSEERTATVYFSGGTSNGVVLNQGISGSGFRYANDGYELLGKGDDITITKANKVVFQGSRIIDNTSKPTQLANPASVYCADQGGTLDIRKDNSGGEYGICVFKDGTECDEWAFYRNECEPGNVTER